ncbi:DUF2231 domain-containing protein [Saccharothrix australiensis]|uniref:DUF2231 domain-containing protein n=1 Tax=Saccharothrix australiensis TaxID=2072 RepID=A0A495VUP8_9PSEU|nr:DUF2231 domain-containing protein [Saccharothrix australiensis]RKT52904.1 hypothetical protein C8E97_1444 [Saccharothrix australiensis]
MALADDLVTIFGLPAHPLLVHAVVVLLPLAAVAAAALAVVPRWRQRYAWPLLGVTLLGVGSVLPAQKAGEQLEARLANLDNPLIRQHAELGNDLLPFALGFGVVVVALLVAGRLADRERAAAADDTAVPRTWRRISVVVAVLVIAAGAATTVQTVRIGHSGSTAVWDGVGAS